MTENSDSYTRWYPALCRASEQLRLILKEIEATIDDKTLVRAEVRNVRIKELSSLERKGAKNGWKSEEAFKECSDLVGGRVVCNNIEDVYRFAQFLKEHLPTDSGEFKVQDYIKQPNQRGYRALHVNFRLNGSDSFVPEFVPCEVQIRTRLQDAWGELTHGDIYKQLELPEDLRARSRDLSKVLAAADKIASAIRRRAVQEATAPEQRPDLRTIASGGLAFVFREIFGRSPPDYVVRQALNVCEELKISSLECESQFLGPLECVDRYLQYFDREGLYGSISSGVSDKEGRWQAFIDYSHIYNRRLLNSQWQIENGLDEEDIPAMEEAAFKMIRLRTLKGLPKVHQIMRSFPLMSHCLLTTSLIEHFTHVAVQWVITGIPGRITAVI